MSRANYKQGIFNPINPTKYRGSTPIVYRSQLEIFFSDGVTATTRCCNGGQKV